MGPKSIEVLWNANDSDLLDSFPRMVQMSSKKLTILLSCNALFEYFVYVLLLNPTDKRRRYLIDHGCTLSEILSVKTVEVETANIEGVADIDVSQYGSISVDILPLEKLILHASSTNSRKERVPTLNEATRFTSAPSVDFFETELEGFLRGAKI